MLDTADIESLRATAYRFRSAIEALPSNQRPLALRDFPYGSCAGASFLLGVYLRQRRNEVVLVGVGRSERHWGTHSWLERGATVIDITADQFSPQNAQVIVTADSAWHRTWKRDAETVPHLVELDAYLQVDLIMAYARISASLVG